MFGIILLGAVTVMSVYVFWRASSVPFLKRRLPRPLLFCLGVILWASFFLGRFIAHSGAGEAALMLELTGMDWMAVLFLTAVCLLAVDLVTGFGLLVRRSAPLLRGLALVLGGLLSVIAVVQGTRAPAIHKYEVYLPGLPVDMDGTVVIGLSDLHLGRLLGERWLEERIAQTEAQRPDMVVLLGDIFEGHGPPRRQLLADLKGLSAPLGVWAVLGNHEFHGGGSSSLDLFDGTDIHLLRNSWREVRPGLVLAGVDDLTANHRSGKDGDAVTEMLADRPRGTTILLSHTPWQADKAAGAGVSLMLSGHTHGGQIWPFGYLVEIRYPLLGGLYRVAGMTVIVSRGAGTWGPRMRLWRRGEILRITLRAGDRKKAGAPSLSPDAI